MPDKLTILLPPDFDLSPDDPRYREVAKRLAIGYTPEECVFAAGFEFPDFTGDDPNQQLTRADIDFANAIVTFPKVADHHRDLMKTDSPAYTLSVEEKRAYLQSVVNTPPGIVTKDSPLCQSYTLTPGKYGDTIKVVMVDKMKALDMDNKMAGHYNEDSKSTGASAETLLEMLQAARG